MVCLGFGPGAAGWKAKTKPWSYGGHRYGGIFITGKVKFCIFAVIVNSN